MNRTVTLLTHLARSTTFVPLALIACGGAEPAPVPPEDPSPSDAPAMTAPTATATPTASATASTAPVASTSAAPPPEPEPAPASELGVDGANLSIGSITADGFTMRDIACKSDDAGGLGGLVLGPALAGVLSKKKAQLRACSPKGGEARVRFVMEGGKIVSAEAKASTPAIEACVTRVVKSAQAPLRGTCAATFDLSR